MGNLFIFDMGEVLITNVRNLFNIANRFDLDYKEFRSFYNQYDTPIMEGRMESMEFFSLMEKRFGLKINEDLFETEHCPLTNGFIVSIIDELKKKGHRCVLGSNTCSSHMKVVEKLPEHPLSHLDRLYESWRMGIVKPKLSFFTYIMEREGVDSEDVVFIDDKVANTEAAKSLGITTYLYNSGKNQEAMEFFSLYLK